jgi:hypothetical protein
MLKIKREEYIMEEMDLNIDNYSPADLESFFGLKKGYTASDLEKREYEIREQLLKSGHVNKKLKRDLIAFLEEAKRMLTIVNAPPTTIPKNARLDATEYPKSKELETSRAPLVIERPLTNYMNVQTSEYYQGVMNPLNTRTIPKNITIDTRHRDNYYTTLSTNFTVQFPNRINKVVSMQLTAIELPKSFYNICSQYENNYFYLEVYEIRNGSTYGSKRLIVIPDGNYTPEGLIEIINRIIQGAGDTIEGGVCKNVKFTWLKNENGSGRTVVGLKDETREIEEIILNFGNDMKGNNDIENIYKKLGWILGFVNIVYCGENYYMSEKPLDCNPIKYLYLAVEDYNKSVNESFITAFEKDGLPSNILARISLYGAGYENMILNMEKTIVCETRKYFGPVDIQRINVRLYDDTGKLVNMNYSDYSFCLNLKLLYDL